MLGLLSATEDVRAQFTVRLNLTIQVLRYLGAFSQTTMPVVHLKNCAITVVILSLSARTTCEPGTSRTVDNNVIDSL